MPPGTSKVKWEHKNDTFQGLCSLREFQQAPSPSSRCFRIINESPLHSVSTFQTAACTLGPKCEYAGEHLKNNIFRSLQPFRFLQVCAPMVFKHRCFRGSSLWCRSQRLKYLMWGTNSSLLKEKLHIVRSLPIVGHCAGNGWGRFLARLCLCLSNHF